MANQQTPNRQRSWQDIAPTRTARPVTPKKATALQRVRLAIRSLSRKPDIIKLKKRISKMTRRNKIIIAIILLLLIGFVMYYFVIIRPSHSIRISKPITVTSLVKGTPEYTTLLPSGKSINDLGGWTRVSPPDRNPVFAYVDTIDMHTINVSQQPLPDDFKQDTATQVSQLAQSFNATEKITVGDTTVYIGTSEKGPQSVIFTKNNLLILIKSTTKISDDQWAKYINTLG